MIRWVGRATQVMAMSKITVPHRRDDEGHWRSVTIPDTVDILARLANGANAHLRFSACAGLSPGNEVWLYGTDGTIHVDSQWRVYGGKRGDGELQEIANPPESRYSWSVEPEFIASIREGRAGAADAVQCGRALYGVHGGGDGERADGGGGVSADVIPRETTP